MCVLIFIYLVASGVERVLILLFISFISSFMNWHCVSFLILLFLPHCSSFPLLTDGISAQPGFFFSRATLAYTACLPFFRTHGD